MQRSVFKNGVSAWGRVLLGQFLLGIMLFGTILGNRADWSLLAAQHTY